MVKKDAVNDVPERCMPVMTTGHEGRCDIDLARSILDTALPFKRADFGT